MRTSTFAAFALSLTLAACGGPAVDQTDDFSGFNGLDEKSDQFSTKMKLLGSMNYGDMSDAVHYHNPPRYRAYKFSGVEGDNVTVTVSSPDGSPVVWVLTNNFGILGRGDDDGSGSATVSVTLKANASATRYIVFREYDLHDATFAVSLEGKGPDLTSCNKDSDCVAVEAEACCPNGTKIALNKNEVSAYEAENVCQNPPKVCPLYVILDTRVAECNVTKHACELVKPEDIRCGGFTTNPHQCAKGWTCEASSIPDVPGTCSQN